MIVTNNSLIIVWSHANVNNKINIKMNMGEGKALHYSRMPTNEHRQNNGIRKLPFGNHNSNN